MKEAMPGSRPPDTINRGRLRPQFITRCSICTHRTWFKTAMYLMEPEGVPEPRQSWVLCQNCYHRLIIEMRRSPVRSPLRLRIAMGMVAAEYWPRAYRPRRQYSSERKLMTVMIWAFFITMILHLALIVVLAYIK
jgi:hypothetical protein